MTEAKHETQGLHPELNGLPIAWQRLIIIEAMSYYFCDDCDYVDAFLAWKQIGDGDHCAFQELDLHAWEPFECFDQDGLWELVDSHIYSLKSFVEAIAAPELLEALAALVNHEWIPHKGYDSELIRKAEDARAAIAKAKGE